MTEFEIDPVIRDETDKEQFYDLYMNKEKILIRTNLKECIIQIQKVMEALDLSKKEDKKKNG